MKKGLMMLGVAAIALASCTNEEVLNVSDSRAIGFNGTGIDNITKADITQSAFTHFYVYGGYNTTPIFDKTEVNYNGGNWQYNPTQYWTAGTWKFAGYEGGEGVEPRWSYEEGLILEVNSDAAHQSDVVYAASSNIIIEDADVATYSTPVSLTFSHLLSKVQFKFLKDQQSLGGVTVKLSDFKVEGITTNAIWKAGKKEDATSPATGAYSDFGTSKEIVASTGLTTEAFYVIPQTIGTFNITANAVVTQNDVKIHSGQIKATVPTVFTEWTAQNYYIYTATVTMENIKDPDDPDQKPNPIEFTGTTADDWNTPTQEGEVTLD